MKQKLALISAFVHTPKLLILDEPFVGLDPRAAFTLKSVMKESVKRAIRFSSRRMSWRLRRSSATRSRLLRTAR
jgi:ABC-type multidrug transport system ATPase subunit